VRLGARLLPALALLACSEAGPAGPNGEDVVGPPGEPGASGASVASLTLVSPSRVYLGRDVEVSISGSGTRWSADEVPEIDAGDGIEVVAGSIVVVSPTALRVTLRVADDAPTGLRDLAVCPPSEPEAEPCAERGEAAVADRALAVQAALEAYTVDGQLLTDLPQGSIAQGRVIQLDPTTPFTPVLGDIELSIGPGSTGIVADYGGPDNLVFFVLVDVKATTGSRAVIVEHGPEGAVTRSITAPGALRVLERPPAELFPGTSSTSLPYVDASLLYEIKQPEQGTIVTIEARGDDPAALADVYLLDDSGRFSDVRDNSVKLPGSARVRALIPKPVGSLYLIYRGFGGGSSYPLELELSETSDAGVRPLGAGGEEGQLDAPGDADWFSFIPPQGTIKVSIEGAGAASCGPGGTIDSELVVLRDDGTRIATNDNFGASRCSSVVFESEGGSTHYVTVMSSRTEAPLQTFPYRVSYEVL